MSTRTSGIPGRCAVLIAAWLFIIPLVDAFSSNSLFLRKSLAGVGGSTAAVGLSSTTAAVGWSSRMEPTTRMACQLGRKTALGMAMKQADGVYEENKYTVRFRNMLGRVASYSDVEIAGIQDAKMRSIVQGVADALDDPEVELAFRILYEDMSPLRFCGDRIFNHIDKMVTEGGKKLLEFGQRSDISEDALVEARNLFSMVDQDNSGKLDKSEVEYFLKTLKKIGVDSIPWDGAEQFVESMDGDKDAQISFDEFAKGVHGMFRLSEAEREEVEKMGMVLEGSVEKDSNNKDNQKYMNMLKTIKKWEQEGNWDNGGGRVQAILTGCFAGARRPKVVEALRIVYVDYPPIRMGGDLVFTLLNQFMSRRKK